MTGRLAKRAKTPPWKKPKQPRTSRVFASHGDFRGFLYEATTISMPQVRSLNREAQTEVIFRFRTKIERYNSCTGREKVRGSEFRQIRNRTARTFAFGGKKAAK
jgi:hypothetical protein